MSWSEIPEVCPLSMQGLLAFMERWKAGSTEALVGATPETIAALSAPLAASGKTLPSVYLDYLATMGESTGELTLTRGAMSASRLLADREELEHIAADPELMERYPWRRAPDPSRYFKFSIGDMGDSGRADDEFFDLERPTADGRDAAVLQVRGHLLASGAQPPDEPFATFSDLVRAVVMTEFALDQDRATFGFGDDPAAPARVFELLEKLGFEVNELGASKTIVALEAAERGAIAMLDAPSPTISGTFLDLRALNAKERHHLIEVISEHDFALPDPPTYLGYLVTADARKTEL